MGIARLWHWRLVRRSVCVCVVARHAIEIVIEYQARCPRASTLFGPDKANQVEPWRDFRASQRKSESQGHAHPARYRDEPISLGLGLWLLGNYPEWLTRISR